MKTYNFLAILLMSMMGIGCAEATEPNSLPSANVLPQTEMDKTFQFVRM